MLIKLVELNSNDTNEVLRPVQSDAANDRFLMPNEFKVFAKPAAGINNNFCKHNPQKVSCFN